MLRAELSAFVRTLVDNIFKAREPSAEMTMDESFGLLLRIRLTSSRLDEEGEELDPSFWHDCLFLKRHNYTSVYLSERATPSGAWQSDDFQFLSSHDSCWMSNLETRWGDVPRYYAAHLENLQFCRVQRGGADGRGIHIVNIVRPSW